MKMRRIAVPALLATAVCAVPASAGAATLAPGKPCFGDGDPITLGGTGFTPGAPVTVAADGRQFNGALTSTATGTIAGRLLPFSLVAGKTQNSVFTATDTANPANIGQTTVVRARLRVTVTPANASPRSTRRFRATGFTAGTTLYRHITRAGRRQQRQDEAADRGLPLDQREEAPVPQERQERHLPGAVRHQAQVQLQDAAAGALPRPGVPDRAPGQLGLGRDGHPGRDLDPGPLDVDFVARQVLIERLAHT